MELFINSSNPNGWQQRLENNVTLSKTLILSWIGWTYAAEPWTTPLLGRIKYIYYIIDDEMNAELYQNSNYNKYFR